MEKRRSSDKQILLLQEKLDNHIEEYQRHRREEEKRWGKLISCQEVNTTSIKELTESTRDLISVWQSVNGTMRTMAALGRLVKWLGGFAILGGVGAWLVDYFK